MANMWIERDLFKFLKAPQGSLLPVKILKGPRQVGKTSLLDYLGTHRLVLFDDLAIRSLAQKNPTFFFEQFTGPLILDEATMVPEIFSEIKRRVDLERREMRTKNQKSAIDLWVTGSNQTLLQKVVRESLSGRANYFSLNTLSLHELNRAFNHVSLEQVFMRGGWPELYVNQEMHPVQYLNDFISTFIEKDILLAAGIEKRAAFTRALQLLSGRVGQIFNASDIAKNIGIEVTTVQGWTMLFENNGILRVVNPYHSNLNQRLIKAPKVYFEDVALALRLQGWSEYSPFSLSPYFGSLFENLVLTEISRFFTNRGLNPEIFFLRSKDQVEIDFLVSLPNQRYLAIEVKTTPQDFTKRQLNLLKTLKLNIVEKWVVSWNKSHDFENASAVCLSDLFDCMEELF